MDLHRFDADLDPVFHFDADPKKSGSYFTFSHVGKSFSSAHNFQYFGQYHIFKFSVKKSGIV